MKKTKTKTIKTGFNLLELAKADKDRDNYWLLFDLRREHNRGLTFDELWDSSPRQHLQNGLRVLSGVTGGKQAVKRALIAKAKSLGVSVIFIEVPS